MHGKILIHLEYPTHQKHSERSDECCTSWTGARQDLLASKQTPSKFVTVWLLYIFVGIGFSLHCFQVMRSIYFSHQERFRLFRWSDIVHRCIISQFLGRSIKFIRVRPSYFMRGQVSPCETKLSRVRPSFSSVRPIRFLPIGGQAVDCFTYKLANIINYN